MTDQTDATTEPTDEQTDEQTVPVVDDQQDTDEATEDTGGKPGREAAKYRRQLRDTEAERDTLKGTVEALQRRMVADVASRQLAKPDALWAAGVEIDSLLGDDGLPDSAKIRAACADASDRLGLARPLHNHSPNEGHSPAAANGNGFADAFGPGGDS